MQKLGSACWWPFLTWLLLTVLCPELRSGFLLVIWWLAFWPCVKECEHVIRPDVTLCWWRNVKIQELTNQSKPSFPKLLCHFPCHARRSPWSAPPHSSLCCTNEEQIEKTAAAVFPTRPSLSHLSSKLRRLLRRMFPRQRMRWPWVQFPVSVYLASKVVAWEHSRSGDSDLPQGSATQ